MFQGEQPPVSSGRPDDDRRGRAPPPLSRFSDLGCEGGATQLPTVSYRLETDGGGGRTSVVT